MPCATQQPQRAASKSPEEPTSASAVLKARAVIRPIALAHQNVHARGGFDSRRRKLSLCARVLLQNACIVLTPLQLGTLLFLQWKDVFAFVGHGRVGGLEIAAKLGETSRLERCCVVGALPSSVLREVALDPLSTEGVGSNVNGNAQMVT